MSEHDDMSVLWKRATEHMTEHNTSFDYIQFILRDCVIYIIVELKIKNNVVNYDKHLGDKGTCSVVKLSLLHKTVSDINLFNNII